MISLENLLPFEENSSALFKTSILNVNGTYIFSIFNLTTVLLIRGEKPLTSK